MAIDTAVKRSSIIGIGSMLFPSLIPNVLKPRQWKQGVIGTYAGIAARALWVPETPETDGGFTPEAPLSDTWTPEAPLTSVWS